MYRQLATLREHQSKQLIAAVLANVTSKPVIDTKSDVNLLPAAAFETIHATHCNYFDKFDLEA
jgi:hypothetical protein